MDGGIAPEPGKLPLGVAPGCLANLRQCFRFCHCPVQRGKALLVADGLHGGGPGADALGQKMADLVQ